MVQNAVLESRIIIFFQACLDFPGLRQGREACLPGLISFVTVSTPNFEFSEKIEWTLP